MNCREFEGIVLSLVRDPGPHASALAHTQDCAPCAARLAAEQAFCFGVRAVNTEIANEEAPARVEAALLTAFRAVRPHPAGKLSREPRFIIKGNLFEQLARRMRAHRFAGATALFILLSLGLLWLKVTPNIPPQKAMQPPQTNLAPPQDNAAENVAVNNDVAVPTPKPAPAIAQRLKPRRIISRAPVPANEAPSPFYPLVGEGELAPLESGRVMRVEVPAATLIRYGVSLTAEAMNQPVQADLLLGQDGLARAIRFLPPNQTTKPQ